MLSNTITGRPALHHPRDLSMIRAAFFDFDGTLADSFAAITASTNHVRESYGLPALAEAAIRGYVGHGLANLMDTLVPNARTDEAVARYRAHHQTAMISGTRLMPGVAETIPELARRGLRLGVCSNKRVEFTRQLVEALGLGPYFACVLGPEDVGDRPKPDPSMLLEGLRRLEVSPSETVYVGDMDVDVQTARAAGVPVCLVLGGATDAKSAATAARQVLTTFSELLELLPRVRGVVFVLSRPFSSPSSVGRGPRVPEGVRSRYREWHGRRDRCEGRLRVPADRGARCRRLRPRECRVHLARNLPQGDMVSRQSRRHRPVAVTGPRTGPVRGR